MAYGLASGIAEGLQGAMQLGRQRQLLQMEQNRMNMEQWSSISKIFSMAQTDPGLAQASLSAFLPRLGMDPKQGAGKFYMDTLTKATSESLKSMSDFAATAGINNIPTNILSKYASDPIKLMEFAKTMNTSNDRALDAEVTARNPVGVGGGAQPIPPASPPPSGGTLDVNNPSDLQKLAQVAPPIGSTATDAAPPTQATTAPQAQPAPQQQGTLGDLTAWSQTGTVAGPNPDVPRNGGAQPAPAPANAPQAAPNAPNAPTNAGLTINIGGKQFPLAPGQGGLAANAANLYKTYMQRAADAEALASSRGVASNLPASYRDQANKLRDNAVVTLTPAQAAEVGYKPGAVVQYNLATGQLTTAQQGEDSFRILSDDEARQKGLNPANGTYQMNTKTNQITPVNVFQNEVALAKGQGEEDIKNLAAIRNAVPAANQQLKQAELMDTLSKNFKTGYAAEPKLLAGRVADLFGLDDISKKLGTASGDALEGLYAQESSELATKLQGRLSGKMLAYVQKAGPALFKTQEGNDILQGMLKQEGQNTIDTATLAEAHLKQPGVKQLSQPDQSGQNFYEKRDAMLAGRGSLPADQEATLERGIADISHGVQGVKNPISQATPQELDKLLAAGQRGQLTSAQLQLARDRWNQLNSQQGNQP